MRRDPRFKAVMRAEMRPFSLAFEPELERRFMEDYTVKSLPLIRLTLLVSALFYTGFGILDRAVAPGATRALWLIRFGVFLPGSMILFALTYFRFFHRIWQWAVSVWGLVAGLGIVAMIGIVQGEARSSYYAGLIMVFIVLYTWTRVRFVWATAAGWVIVLAYEVLTVGFLRMPSHTVLIHNFFFIGSNILGMLACYSIERYARMDFLMNRLLFEEQEKVQQTVQALEAANEELKRLAQIDDLTKIPNRRVFDWDLNLGWKRMVREGRPLSILVCDIDEFREYNESNGHRAGDQCLVKVGQAVAAAARRPADFAARYGADEFALLLLDTPLEGAIHVAETLCQTVLNLRISQPGSPVMGRVTISVGVASIVPTHQRTPDELARRAEELLFVAKGQGRNQVVAGKV
jgi:diguanylate cyclase (GGDEF)-like protein